MDQIAIFDIEDPTHPKNYCSRGPVVGLPRNWQEEVSGQLVAAIMAYLRQEPTPEQLQLVIKYLQHHIHAPIWLDAGFLGPIDPQIAGEIKALREMSLTLNSLAEVNAYIQRALSAAIDPL